MHDTPESISRPIEVSRNPDGITIIDITELPARIHIGEKLTLITGINSTILLDDEQDHPTIGD